MDDAFYFTSTDEAFLAPAAPAYALWHALRWPQTTAPAWAALCRHAQARWLYDAGASLGFGHDLFNWRCNYIITGRPGWA